MAVLQLATSTMTLQAVTETVMSTKLLPGEDQDLLPGPDRISMLRVVAYRAAAVPVGSVTAPPWIAVMRHVVARSRRCAGQRNGGSPKTSRMR